jgi:serine/threonine protein kinase
MTRPQPNSRVGSEPIPGYVLRKRLGAGGYGEVWLADAPGGLQKAIKLVFGTIDESHAAGELRSLQRIRQVNHPFLLSIERIEIVSNQVIIITELAESSLLDRFEQFRRKGAQGIPRSVLLDMMRDAADALDFLSQKHALQHLDIKPGNLLLIADRIKVADFGLVKDLHDNNQSLVSGLTPTYSAPEIFDGRPDYRSDQYSLAIVYMEMLTGHLPFEGRTTGELARQHINQPPNLEPLPPADRPVVARALAKNPLDRYSSCRQFVEQLLKTRSAVLPVVRAVNEQNPDTSDSEKSKTETQVAPADAARQFKDALQPEIVCVDWTNPRSLFIGIGGVGGRALTTIRSVANRDCDGRFTTSDLGWLAIDTDASDLESLCNDETDGSLGSSHTMHLRLYKPQEYRDLPGELFIPLSRRWLYNIPRSLKTEGVRPLAILTMLDHYRQLKQRITAEVKELLKAASRSDDASEPLRIYVVGSLHGGTGSGLVGEMGRLIRAVMAELNCPTYRLCAVMTAATTTQNQLANLPAASAIATVAELHHLMHPECLEPEIYQIGPSTTSRVARPYDWVSLIDGGLHGSQEDLEAALHTLANVVWIDAQTQVGAVLNEDRIENVLTPGGWLRAMTAVPIEVSSRVGPQNLSRWCCEQTLFHSLRYMLGPRGVATSSTSLFEGETRHAPTLSGDLPLTDSACEEITRRLLVELGIVCSEQDISSELRERLCNQWSRRLSRHAEIVRAQLSEDMQIWKQTISKIVQMRVYNWKQIEQIQLNVVEGILNFIDRDIAQLLRLLNALGARMGSAGNVAKAATEYLYAFSESCVSLLSHFQSEGKSLGYRIKTWCESIQAEKTLNEASWEVNIASLPPQLRLLACRVNAVLESTINRMALQALDESERALDLPAANKPTMEVEKYNLSYMLSLASDLVNRMSSELGITAAEFSETGGEEGVSLKKLQKFCPFVNQLGKDIHRLIVVPQEQASILSSGLTKLGLLKSTTVICGTRSLGSYVVTESSMVQPSSVVAAMWRPSPQTLQLAERLRSRTDIEWQPVTTLLESIDYGVRSAVEAKPTAAIVVDGPDPAAMGQTTPIPI